MKLTITIDLDNAVFEEDRIEEIDRILKGIPSRLPLEGETNGNYSLHDLNGNYCGEFFIVSE